MPLAVVSATALLSGELRGHDVPAVRHVVCTWSGTRHAGACKVPRPGHQRHKGAGIDAATTDAAAAQRMWLQCWQQEYCALSVVLNTLPAVQGLHDAVAIPTAAGKHRLVVVHHECQSGVLQRKVSTTVGSCML